MNTLENSIAAHGAGFDTPRPRTVSRRVKAILAGGLVLGLGAAVTLAAWNDSEFALGSFAAGTFGLEGSATDGSTFAEHAAVGSPVGLTFNGTGMSPDQTLYAPFAVRLSGGSTLDGTVTVTNADSSGPLTGLSYTVIMPSAWGCDSGTTGTSLIPTTALGTVPGSTTFAITHGAGSTPGTPIYLCFAVTSSSTLVQGSTNTVTWQFDAQSS
ncbi:MAG: SipW-dependent-type signal peptide-containing protein [Pseudolysinimonas sp.]